MHTPSGHKTTPGNNPLLLRGQAALLDSDYLEARLAELPLDDCSALLSQCFKLFSS